MSNDDNQIKGKEQFEIKQVDKITDDHWKLLLLADPSKDLVERYLQSGKTFEFRKNTNLAAIMVLKEVSQFKLEIKNIAVNPTFENQGIATRLLKYAFCYAKKHQYQQVLIGTGSTSFKQLYLYQKMGFRISYIKRDFFVKNYKYLIHENGLLLRDMLVLVFDCTELKNNDDKE